MGFKPGSRFVDDEGREFEVLYVDPDGALIAKAASLRPTHAPEPYGVPGTVYAELPAVRYGQVAPAEIPTVHPPEPQTPRPRRQSPFSGRELELHDLGSGGEEFFVDSGVSPV